MTEKEREYFKKYREEHKAELSEYSKQYYRKNKEKEKARRKQYYSNPENREKRREQARLRYQRLKNDAEYIARNRANHAKWQRENKDKVNAYHRERRKLAKMKGGAE